MLLFMLLRQSRGGLVVGLNFFYFEKVLCGFVV